MIQQHQIQSKVITTQQSSIQRSHHKEVSSFVSQVASTPPANVNLKPFFRESSQERNRQMKQIAPQSQQHQQMEQQQQEQQVIGNSLEEQHPVPESEQRQNNNQHHHSGVLGRSGASRSGNGRHTGTSLFYEPSAGKPENNSRVEGRPPINNLELALLMAEPRKDYEQQPPQQQQNQQESFSYGQQPVSTYQMRSRSSPAPGAALRNKFALRTTDDPSFGSFQHNLSYGDKTNGGSANMNDQSMRNKRSVQVPNPENRVLFELTTISAELGRDNMTTVQTTLIPNSNRSIKHLGPPVSGQHLRQESSELAGKYFVSQEPIQASHPFIAEPNQYNQKDTQIQPVQSLNAYREIVMNQARRQLGIENDYPKFSGLNKQSIDQGYHHQTTSALPIPDQRGRGRGDEEAASSTLDLKSQFAANQREEYRKKAHSTHSQRMSNVQPASTENGIDQLSKLSPSLITQGNKGVIAASQRQKFLSTEDGKAILNFDQITPGGYEDTTEEQAYTYSMYTETLLNNELNSGEKSKGNTSRYVTRNNSGFRSVPKQTTDTHASYILTNQNNNEGGEQYQMNLSQRKELDIVQTAAEQQEERATRNTLGVRSSDAQSPEREIFAEGYDTAMFAHQQLKKLTQENSSPGVKSKPPRMQKHQSSIMMTEDESKSLAPTTSHQLHKQSRHVHSDSIMSAQFQADSVHQMMSQETNNNAISPYVQQPPVESGAGGLQHNAFFSQSIPSGLNVQGGAAGRNQPSQAYNSQTVKGQGLVSDNSMDRKTFTLYERGANGIMSGHGGITSKTDIQSHQYNLMTSPTELIHNKKQIVVTSATNQKSHMPLNINPATQQFEVLQLNQQQQHSNPLPMTLSNSVGDDLDHSTPMQHQALGVQNNNFFNDLTDECQKIQHQLQNNMMLRQQQVHQRQEMTNSNTDVDDSRSLSPRARATISQYAPTGTDHIKTSPTMTHTQISQQKQQQLQQQQHNQQNYGGQHQMQQNNQHFQSGTTYDFPLSQPYQASDQLNSHGALERGASNNNFLAQNGQNSIAQQPQIAHSHRPQITSGSIGIQQRSSSTPGMLAAISDPSVQQHHPSQSQLGPIGGTSLTSQQIVVPFKANPHFMSNQFVAQDDSMRIPYDRRHPSLPQQQLHQQKMHSSYSPNRSGHQNQQPSLNTQRAMVRNNIIGELSMEAPAGFELTPLSHRAQHQTINVTNQGGDQSQQPTPRPYQLGTLQHNYSQVTTGTLQTGINNQNNQMAGRSEPVLKQEILMLRKHLNDARNSNLFLKKQALQLQHQINMQQIQMGQLQEAVGVKDTVQEEDQAKLGHLEERYDEQRQLGEALLKKQEESEELYQQRLHMQNDEIEHLRNEKLRHGYRIQANVMQLSAAMQHLSDISGGEQSPLTPFLTHFEKVCQTLQAQIGAMTFVPNEDESQDENKQKEQMDSRHQLKMMKRAHNFEKFRKEIRNLCKSHYRSKIQDRDVELEKALKHIKSQEKVVQNTSKTCQSMRVSYDQAQQCVKGVTYENEQIKHQSGQIMHENEQFKNAIMQMKHDFNHMKRQFDQVKQEFGSERLRLEKVHLKEIARLHKAVKNMKKKAISFEVPTKVDSNFRQSKQSLQTVVSESEDALTTIDHQTIKTTQPGDLSSIPSDDNLIQSVFSNNNPAKYSQQPDEGEKQLLLLQNEQFRQTLDGQNVLIQELQKALVYNQDLHAKQHFEQEQQLLKMYHGQNQTTQLTQQTQQTYQNTQQNSSVELDEDQHQHQLQQWDEQVTSNYHQGAINLYQAQENNYTGQSSNSGALGAEPMISNQQSGRNDNECDLFQREQQIAAIQQSLQQYQQATFTEPDIQVINEQSDEFSQQNSQQQQQQTHEKQNTFSKLCEKYQFQARETDGGEDEDGMMGQYGVQKPNNLNFRNIQFDSSHQENHGQQHQQQRDYTSDQLDYQSQNSRELSQKLNMLSNVDSSQTNMTTQAFVPPNI